MFIESEAIGVTKGDEVHHFLQLRKAVFAEPTSKRMRLNERRVQEVTSAGGLLFGSEKQLAALRELGVSKVMIDTDQCDVLPDEVSMRVEDETRRVSVVPETPGDQPNRPAVELAVESLDVEVPGGPATIPVANWGEKPQPKLRSKLAAYTNRRKNFGPAQTGWMKVDISATARRAILRVLSFGGDTRLGAKDIIEALEREYGLSKGVDTEAVRRLAQRAMASPERVIRGEFTIATDLDPDVFGRIQFTCLKDVPRDKVPAYQQLREAFSQRTLEVVLRPIPTKVVYPEQELAVFVPAAEVEYGKDETAAGPEQIAAELLRPSDHVQLHEGRYSSQIYGYLCVLDDEISVVPPLWVSPDHMEAHFIHLPRVGSDVPMTMPWLEQLSMLMEVSEGFQEDAVQALFDTPVASSEASSVLLARGTPPRAAGDDVVRLPFEDARADGDRGADHAETETEVEADELLAIVTPGTEPMAGRDVAGREVPASTANVVLMAGTNVRSEDRDGRRYVYAECNGHIHLRNQVLSIRFVSYIDGDVEGNLETEIGNDLHVRGSVRSGTTLISGGRLTVDGSVEDRVSILAEDDIDVVEGIAGFETRVETKGDVDSGFVEQASVIARGSATIRDFTEDAQVRAGWLVKLGETDGEGGRVSGGGLSAARGIEARRIECGEGARLAIEASPDISVRLEELDKGLALCRKSMLRIFRTLGVDNINATHFKSIIESVPHDKSKPMVDLIKRLNNIARSREKIRRQKDAVIREQERVYEEAQIRISEHVDAGVQVLIGEALKTTEETGRVMFRRRHGEIVEDTERGGSE